jgi:hypothetical protein
MNGNNSKPFWKYVKSRKQDNIGVVLLTENGHLINDSKSQAEILLISLGGLILYIIGRSRTLFTLYFCLLNKDKPIN